MSLRAVLDSLPEGTTRIEGARGVLAALATHADALVAAGLGPDGDGEVPASELSGRAPLGEVVVDCERLVVRRFRHGGLLRWLSGGRFADPERPFRELRMAHDLASRCVRTPSVVAAWARRAPLLGWRLAVVTRRVEDAVDGAHALERLAAGEVPARAAARLCESLGACVGAQHRAGLLHTDLTPRNMLVEASVFQPDPDDPDEPARVWVLDLDRCRLGEALTDAERHRVLGRLLRYVVRRERSKRELLQRTRVARFLRAYRHALGADPGDEDWKADWRAVAAKARRGSPVHRLGWALEEFFGGGPTTRDGHRASATR